MRALYPKARQIRFKGAFRIMTRYMMCMTKQARLALIDREKSSLMANIARARRDGRIDDAALRKLEQLSCERVELARA